MKTTCNQVLTKYLKENPGFHKKVNLYAIAEDWYPETVGRALRDLCEEGRLQVDYYDGTYAKNLAMYAHIEYQKPIAQRPIIREIDGILKAVYE